MAAKQSRILQTNPILPGILRSAHSKTTFLLLGLLLRILRFPCHYVSCLFLFQKTIEPFNPFCLALANTITSYDLDC